MQHPVLARARAWAADHPTVIAWLTVAAIVLLFAIAGASDRALP